MQRWFDMIIAILARMAEYAFYSIIGAMTLLWNYRGIVILSIAAMQLAAFLIILCIRIF